VADTLSNAHAIATYLIRRGRSAMMYRGYVSLHVRIHDFPTHLNIQFRSSNVLRGVIQFPTDVTPERREVFAVKLQELNRTGRGVMAVMTSDGIGVVSQIPFGKGPVTGTALERMVADVTEHALAVYPVLTELEATGLAAV
jgi:hypothetical protein